jgi:hypothetical protein
MLSSARSLRGASPQAARGPAGVPALRAQRACRRRLACRAQQEQPEAGGAPPAGTTGAPAAPPQQQQPQQPQQPQQQPPLMAKGSGTAMWTGAVSIVCGVAYLALVFLLDSRGGQMLPPPPEAFLP